jgi:hypothetical protein
MIIPEQFGFNCPSALGFLFRYEIQNGSYGRTQFNIGPYGKNVSKRFFSETTWTIETKLLRNDHWKVLYKIRFETPFPSIGSIVKLSPDVATIFYFISEQKTQTL